LVLTIYGGDYDAMGSEESPLYLFAIFLESAVTSARFASTTLLIGFWYDGSSASMLLRKITDEVSLVPRADLCGAAMNPHVSKRTKFWSTTVSFDGLASFVAIILSRIHIAAMLIYAIGYVAGIIIK